MRRVLARGGATLPQRVVQCSGLPSTTSVLELVQNSNVSSMIQRGYRTSSLSLKAASSEPRGTPVVQAPAAAAQAIMDAQYKVFGMVQGNNLRSGRKRLRAQLRGPGVRAWYGLSFDELFPHWVTPIKEEYFRAEQALNRLGKSRIKGKMKPPKKSITELMAFEDAVPDILDQLEWTDATSLLTEEEQGEREMLLSKARNEAEVAAVEALFYRLASDREQRRDVWEAQLSASKAAAGGGGGEEGKEEGKAKKKNNFRFRQGLDDKRLWGQDVRTAAPAAESKQSPAADGTAPGAAAGTAAPPPAPAADAPAPAEAAAATPGDTAATPAPADASGTAPASGDAPAPTEAAPAAADAPAAAAAAAAPQPPAKKKTIFDVDPASTPAEEVEALWTTFVAERASEQWSVLQLAKDNFGTSVLYKDFVRRIEAAGLQPSEESLKTMIAKDTDLKENILAEAARRSTAPGAGAASGAPAAAPAAAYRRDGAQGQGQRDQQRPFRRQGGNAPSGRRDGGNKRR